MKRLVLRAPRIEAGAAHFSWWRVASMWALIGAALIALAYQLPARHVVHVGYNDAAYVQGFSAPVNRWGVNDPASAATTPLRWSTAQSALIFPQIGLPAIATLRLRAAPGTSDPPTVAILLNGRDELARFRATREWQTYTLPITTGLLKANDLFLEIRAMPLVELGGERRGVQVDQATLATVAWPIMPYPAQLVYGALTVGLGSLLVRRTRARRWGALAIGLAFVLTYRLQLTPYPLRSLLPTLALVFGAIVVVRALPALQTSTARWRWLPLLGSLVVLAVWSGWIALAAQQHVVPAIPGVERDFPVFVTRATRLICSENQGAAAPCVLRADGFYQLGYPFLLWLIKPLTNANAFLAAQVVAIGSSIVMLAATYALGARMLRAGPALLAMVVLALNPFFVQYSLLAGTDMPFAALWIAGIAALLVPSKPCACALVLAGIVCGAAFLVRHPGLVLLPFGWIALWAQAEQRRIVPRRARWQRIGWFTLGWLIAASPQIVVNLIDTGQPLYSAQAKNIWLAVYGNIDYSRWNEAANDVALRDLILADPARFLGNWARNLRAFIGTGAEDTSEFGQAIGLRLLGFPANWLALIGLGLWAWRGDRRARLVVVGAALYVLGVSVGFALPRFFLPLAPIWALAGVVPVLLLARQPAAKQSMLSSVQWAAVAVVALLVALAAGPQIGVQAVLERQNADAATLVAALQQRMTDADRVALALPSSDLLTVASALPYVTTTNDSAARFVVWSEASGERPAIVGDRAPVATFGAYVLFELQ